MQRPDMISREAIAAQQCWRKVDQAPEMLVKESGGEQMSEKSESADKRRLSRADGDKQYK